MASDDKQLMAQFDRKARAERAAIVPEPDIYEAFKVMDQRQPALFVKPVAQPCQWVNYSYWLNTVADPEGTRLDIVFSFLVIVITGRNLLGLGEAIATGHCKFIHQFNPAMDKKPKESSAPLVESIVYTVAGARREADKELAKR